MKTIVIVATVLVVVVAISTDTYNPKYDNFDVDQFNNIRLLENYGKCFLAEGPCTPEGADFRNIIPEALKTNCAKCTPKQRKLIRTVCRDFQTKLPEIWDKLLQKEDPTGEYRESLEKFLNSSD